MTEIRFLSLAWRTTLHRYCLGLHCKSTMVVAYVAASSVKKNAWWCRGAQQGRFRNKRGLGENKRVKPT